MPLTGPQKITAVISTVVGVVLWQHFARVFDFPYKPSWAIDRLGDGIEWALKWLGRLAALASSLFEWLKLDELLISIYEIFASLAHLVAVTMTSFIVGYLDTIVEYALTPAVVIGGSCFLVSMLIVLLAYNVFSIRQRSRAVFYFICACFRWIGVRLRIVSPQQNQPANEKDQDED